MFGKRSAALLSAQATPGPGLRVSADALDAALDELPDTRNAITRASLGGAPVRSPACPHDEFLD